MNEVVLCGRLTRDPDVRNSIGESRTSIARYALAVDRWSKKDGKNQADFISCVVFGKGAEFAERYLRKGMKIMVHGSIKTGSYTNRDGIKIYTTEVIVDRQEFAESKKDGDYQSQNTPPENAPRDEDGFVSVPDDVYDDLPFDQM